jgi:cation:H+ antiporter
MVILTLAMFAMSYGLGNTGRINRTEGAVLLLAFVGYQWALFS